MSASSKKQQRKAEQAEALTQKQRRERAEAQAGKHRNIFYSVVGVVCLVAAVALLVWNNSGAFDRYSVAATVDGVDYKVSDLQYYYVQARNSMIYQSQYYEAQYGFNITDYDYNTADGAQWYKEEDGETWADYFRESALSSLKQTAALCADAKAQGYTLSEDGQDQLDDQLAQIDLICAKNAVSRSTYFSQVYGKGVTEKVYRRNLENDILASDYASYHQENISYDEEALKAYYDENSDTLDSYDYRIFTIDGSASGTVDADGNTVEATEEEKTAAMAAAKEKADAAVAEIEAASASRRERAFLSVAPNYVADSMREAYEDEAYSLQEGVLGSSLSSTASEWLMEEGRKAGDVTAIETSSGYQIVLFLDRYLVEDPTVNIRHILIRAETSDGAETNANGVAVPTQEQMDAAKAELQTVLDEWNAKPAEERTAEAFGALAEQYSDDGGSNTNGGRYTYVSQGQMVANFDAWCFDPARQPGDVGMVENGGDDAGYYGWHLIYFEGAEEPSWKGTAIAAKREADQSEWLTAVTDAVTLAEANGMSKVGEGNTIEPTPSESPVDEGEAEPEPEGSAAS